MSGRVDAEANDADSSRRSSKINFDEYRSLVPRFRRSPMVQPKRPQSGGRLQLKDDSLRETRGGGMKLVSLHEANVAFHRAAASGNIEEVRKFLSKEKFALDSLDEYGFSALHYAAQYNKLSIANILLDFGAKVEIRGTDGSTPLHLAARFNSMEALQSLLKGGASAISTNSITGSTALHEAAAFGNRVIVEHLLKKEKVNVNSSDFKDVTPLMLASGSGDSVVCQILLQNGASVDQYSAEGMTALHFAATNGDPHVTQQIIEAAIVRYLRRRPSDVAEPQLNGDFRHFVNKSDMDGSTALHLAVQTGWKEVSQVLIQYGAEVNCKNKSLQTPLYLAAVGGHEDAMRMLIKNGADVNARESQQKTPLHSAASLGSIKCVHILHGEGAEIDARDHSGQTPLHHAVIAGQIDSTRLLLSFGASERAQDKRLRCCLHFAVEQNREDTLKLLLGETGTELVNLPDHKQRTPLHYAACASNPKLLDLILDIKANACVRDKNHRTPLHMAADQGTARQVKVLTQAAPSCVWMRDDLRRTPLHYAVMGMKRKSCVILLEMGADINSPDILGWTPLLWAAKTGNAGVTELLLERGVLMNHVDIDGNTAFHVSAHFGNVDITRLLLDYGMPLLLNKHGMTGLDVAMETQNSEVVMVIVKHQRWRELLSKRGPEKPNTMEKLIEHFPDAASIVMDRCIQRSTSEHSIKYDFTLLDPGPDDQSGLHKERFLGLMTMIKHKQQILLTHPLARKLLLLKWSKFGWFVYGGNLLLYSLFLLFLTTFTLTERDNVEFPDPDDPETFPDEEFYKEKSSFNEAVPIIVIMFSLVHIAKEIYQIYSQRFRYFEEWSNALEWVLYVTAFLFVLPYVVDDTGIRAEYDIYWQMGTFSIFLGYVNAILITQPLKYVGLYVTMFIEVMKTVLKVLCLVVLFVVAFSMAFYILLKEQASFSSFGKTFIKVTVMTTGELDYLPNVIDVLHQFRKNSTIPLLPYPDSTYIFYYIFILAMPIALVNLLIGLAVGDIEAIQKTAYLRNKGKQITFIADVERKFPKFFTRRMYTPTEIVTVGVGTNKFWRKRSKIEEFQDEDLLGENDLEIDEMTLTLENLTKEMEKAKQRQKIVMNSVEQQRDILLALATHVGLEVTLPNRPRIDSTS